MLQQKALDFLARREHSEFELKQKLIRRDFIPEEIDALLNSLKEKGLLNEERFIQSYINRRSKLGFGPKHIAQGLKQCGIKVLPDLVLDEENVYWEDLLKKVWLKKFKILPASSEDYVRQMRFLLQRGFNSNQIRKAFRNPS